MCGGALLWFTWLHFRDHFWSLMWSHTKPAHRLHGGAGLKLRIVLPCQSDFPQHVSCKICSPTKLQKSSKQHANLDIPSHHTTTTDIQQGFMLNHFLLGALKHAYKCNAMYSWLTCISFRDSFNAKKGFSLWSFTIESVRKGGRLFCFQCDFVASWLYDLLIWSPTFMQSSLHIHGCTQ